MGHLQDLLQWAKRNGVVLRGIQPTEIPGRGIGMIAARTLKAGEIVLEAPHQVIRCLNTIPQDIRQKLPAGMSIHGLLAADLALKTSLPSQWSSVLPSMTDLEAGMPALWPEELQNLLPPTSARGIFQAQKANLRRDWEKFKNVFPHVQEGEFKHAWLLVNSRTFLHETAETEKYPWEDRLALVPLADFFNHGEVPGCKVHFAHRSGGYDVTSMMDHRKGEEVFISYGTHSNDFMLVEYGFILDRNPWDEVHLDHIILPRLSEEQKTELGKRSLLGKYPLSSSDESYRRTQAVLHLLSSSSSLTEWGQFMDRKERRSTEDQKRIHSYMVDLLESFQAEIQGNLASLEKLEVGQEAQRSLLRRRWEQIQGAVKSRIDELGRGR